MPAPTEGGSSGGGGWATHFGKLDQAANEWDALFHRRCLAGKVVGQDAHHHGCKQHDARGCGEQRRQGEGLQALGYGGCIHHSGLGLERLMEGSGAGRGPVSLQQPAGDCLPNDRETGRRPIGPAHT